MSGCPIATILADEHQGRTFTVAQVGLTPSTHFVEIAVPGPLTATEADALADALRLAANEIRRNSGI